MGELITHQAARNRRTLLFHTGQRIYYEFSGRLPGYDIVSVEN